MRARAAAALGSVAVTLLLAGCTRPVPYLTVFTGSDSYQVPPQRWCFDGNLSHCRTVQSYAPETVRAAAGSTILVDVPAVVAQDGWFVTASVNQNGKQTTINSASSGLVTDRHNTRVQVPSDAAGGSYFLTVQSTNGQQPTGVWGVLVQVSS